MKKLPQVGVLRVKGKIADLHVFEHALSQCCHGNSFAKMECAASSRSMVSQRSVRRKGDQPGMQECRCDLNSAQPSYRAAFEFKISYVLEHIRCGKTAGAF